jgi:hypothetical protein
MTWLARLERHSDVQARDGSWDSSGAELAETSVMEGA